MPFAAAVVQLVYHNTVYVTQILVPILNTEPKVGVYINNLNNLLYKKATINI